MANQATPWGKGNSLLSSRTMIRPANSSPYGHRIVVLATKNGKERRISRAFRAALDAVVIVPPDLNTDSFGTFTSELPRIGSPKEVALRKARAGMQLVGKPLGLASEGSFGPDPQIPWHYADLELLVFVDEELGMELTETVFTNNTNFGHCTTRRLEGAEGFLERAQFPSHALIVRPNDKTQQSCLFKGIVDFSELQSAIDQCAAASSDGLAHIENDMRSHMNPTRRIAIRHVAFKLARRLAALCPACGAPGWGIEDTEKGLPCGNFGALTALVRYEISLCWRCSHFERKPRRNARQYAEPRDCPVCDP